MPPLTTSTRTRLSDAEVASLAPKSEQLAMDLSKPTVPYGLCHCGCGEKTRPSPRNNTGLGYAKGEPQRFVAGHQGRSSPEEYKEEDRGYATPCWIWQRAINRHTGYGTFNQFGATNAHRAVFIRERGPIPKGLHLDHLCRVRSCVTPAENVRRGAKTKLTYAEVSAIRASDASTVDLAVRFGVSGTNIDHIRAGRSWAA